MSGENDIVIEAWNTVLFDKFCRFKHLLIDGLAAHSNEVLARRNFAEGLRVLDVGCGFGDSTRLIARHVGDAELRVREMVPVVAHEDTDQVHCGPGPFSMAGPDMVSTMLRSAGYDRIGLERFDADICIRRDVEEAIEFAMALGPAGEIIRLAGEEGAKRKPEVVAALRETLARYVRADGVWAPSSTWFVSARNPG